MTWYLKYDADKPESAQSDHCGEFSDKKAKAGESIAWRRVNL